MKIVLINNKAVATHSDDQHILSLYGSDATAVIVPDGTHVNLITGEYDHTHAVPAYKSYSPLHILFGIDAFGKSEEVLAIMSPLETALFNSSTELNTNDPQFPRVQAVIDRIVTDGILTQAQIDVVMTESEIK